MQGELRVQQPAVEPGPVPLAPDAILDFLPPEKSHTLFIWAQLFKTQQNCELLDFKIFILKIWQIH